MMRTTEFAHLLVRQALQDGDWVIDATVGNGHDTALLAELVGRSGKVFGFDIQKNALEAAGERLGPLPHVTLFHAGHEEMTAHLPEDAKGRIAAIMFNLGYLPGSAKDVITREDTTLAALEQAIELLKPHGLITLVLYPGHEGGAEEAGAVRAYVRALAEDFAVNTYARVNSARPAPELIAIERIG